jgi:hypothetical protein
MEDQVIELFFSSQLFRGIRSALSTDQSKLMAASISAFFNSVYEHSRSPAGSL